MTQVDVKLPPKLVPVFAPPRGELRYRGAYGGRGSAKSFSFAKMAAIYGYMEPLRILCTRDIQDSIKESFHAELKNAIASEPWLAAAYDVGVDYLRGHNGTEFIFKGLRHNISSIKSTAQIDLCIVEEAEDVPQYSWDDLEPTIRTPKSEIWVVWNPKKQGSPVDKLFRDDVPERSKIISLNWRDNPWFPDVLEEQRKRAQRIMDPGKYAHIWEGSYLKNSDAQVMNGKWAIDDFDPCEDWDGPYLGADWGFSTDPTTLVKCWVSGERLYIEREAYKVGCELDATPALFDSAVPGCRGYLIRADNARPETISHIAGKGFRIEACKKWPGSVEDGIAFMRSFEKIIIHSRCEHVAQEFMDYSYKIDRLTGDVLTAIIDKNNHTIDAIRYALGPLIQRNKPIGLSLKRAY